MQRNEGIVPTNSVLKIRKFGNPLILYFRYPSFQYCLGDLSYNWLYVGKYCEGDFLTYRYIIQTQHGLLFRGMSPNIRFILSYAHTAKLLGGPSSLITFGKCCVRCTLGLEFIIDQPK